MGHTPYMSLLYHGQSIPPFTKTPVQSWNPDHVMQQPVVLVAEKCLLTTSSKIYYFYVIKHSLLGKRQSLIKTTTKYLYLKNQHFSSASPNSSPTCIHQRYLEESKGESCIVINNTAQSVIFSLKVKPSSRLWMPKDSSHKHTPVAPTS